MKRCKNLTPFRKKVYDPSSTATKRAELRQRFQERDNRFSIGLVQSKRRHRRVRRPSIARHSFRKQANCLLLGVSGQARYSRRSQRPGDIRKRRRRHWNRGASQILTLEDLTFVVSWGMTLDTHRDLFDDVLPPSDAFTTRSLPGLLLRQNNKGREKKAAEKENQFHGSIPFMKMVEDSRSTASGTAAAVFHR
jgi:hypothetical protein